MGLSAVIVQARMTSTRLPGKVLLPLGDTTLLDQVLARCAAVRGIDKVICAVPEGAAHDAVAEEAAVCGADVFRGSELDVLDRYARAAAWAAAETVMRVTSDCPLIDPMICGHVLNLVRCGGADFACNNMPRSFPHGLDCEAFPARLLAAAAGSARLPEQREHVTPWMREHQGLRRVSLVGPGGKLAEMRVTVDTADDLSHVRKIFSEMAVLPGKGSATRLMRRVFDREIAAEDFSILDKLGSLRPLLGAPGVG
jgi:spore coat polysaccharide biosynthesis protein SpsF (cytidylyltransferase family)